MLNWLLNQFRPGPTGNIHSLVSAYANDPDWQARVAIVQRRLQAQHDKLKAVGKDAISRKKV